MLIDDISNTLDNHGIDYNVVKNNYGDDVIEVKLHNFTFTLEEAYGYGKVCSSRHGFTGIGNILDYLKREA